MLSYAMGAVVVAADPQAAPKPATRAVPTVAELEQVKPSLPVPGDFWKFWNEKTRAVRGSRDEAVVTEVESPDPKVATFDVQVAVPGTKGFSGYLAVPKGAKGKLLPAILFPHSAGVRGSQLNQAVKGAQMGCIALDFNAHGLPNGKPGAFYTQLESGELKGYSAIGGGSRETSYFLGMYLRLIRAVDFMTNRPEWDGRHLIMYGSSQGGGQALIAAGLDDRVTLCLANVPAMCDQTAAVVQRTAGWPRMVEWAKMPRDVARYFDSMNFATRIKCPVMMTVGLMDQTCAPSSVYAAYNSISAKKKIIPRPGMGHAFPKDLIEEFDRRVKEHIADAPSSPPTTGVNTGANTKADGYRGIWFELGEKYEYGDKYSGGLATYTANHVPIAVYSAKANKTFFTYGGTIEGKRHLLIMASCYDHATKQVPRPTVVHDKLGVTDPHDNGSLAVDGEGYVWVFVSGRARGRPGFIYRSTKPYEVEAFEQISEREITYPQPHYAEGRGFLHLFTKYTRGRELYFSTSADGRNWTEDQKLVGFGGHYQVSAGTADGTIGTAFMYHPAGNVNKRTNLYYIKSRNNGKAWTTAEGSVLSIPLDNPKNVALVIDYQARSENVYIHDVNFDQQGNPVILYLTARGAEPGPGSDPRTWRVTRWTGSAWQTSDVCCSDHDYDTGAIYTDQAQWTIIGPTEVSPQKWGTGGEMAMWVSEDQGKSWRKAKDITSGSRFNHSYARRPLGATDPFYAFWADGDSDRFSESRLYFADSGGRCWRLPSKMEGEYASPEPFAGASKN